jgi:hypothetical protein
MEALVSSQPLAFFFCRYPFLPSHSPPGPCYAPWAPWAAWLLSSRLKMWCCGKSACRTTDELCTKLAEPRGAAQGPAHFQGAQPATVADPLVPCLRLIGCLAYGPCFFDSATLPSPSVPLPSSPFPPSPFQHSVTPRDASPIPPDSVRLRRGRRRQGVFGTLSLASKVPDPSIGWFDQELASFGVRILQNVT